MGDVKSTKVEREVEDVVEPPKKPGFFARLFGRKK
jgi:hypothetical protein